MNPDHVFTQAQVAGYPSLIQDACTCGFNFLSNSAATDFIAAQEAAHQQAITDATPPDLPIREVATCPCCPPPAIPDGVTFDGSRWYCPVCQTSWDVNGQHGIHGIMSTAPAPADSSTTTTTTM